MCGNGCDQSSAASADKNQVGGFSAGSTARGVLLKTLPMAATMKIAIVIAASVAIIISVAAIKPPMAKTIVLSNVPTPPAIRFAQRYFFLAAVR
jgi:hypothetical protein